MTALWEVLIPARYISPRSDVGLVGLLRTEIIYPSPGTYVCNKITYIHLIKGNYEKSLYRGNGLPDE